jgi:hypothetical protein
MSRPAFRQAIAPRTSQARMPVPSSATSRSARSRTCFRVRDHDVERDHVHAPPDPVVHAHDDRDQPAAAARPSLTFGQAVDKYLAAKSRKRSLRDDRQHLAHLKAAFGADTRWPASRRPGSVTTGPAAWRARPLAHGGP